MMTRKTYFVVCGLALAISTTCAAAWDARSETQPHRRSPEQIRAAVEALWKQDVAWREIAWRTCLIDGLRESRRAGKPLMLWVFIDRPIDDERC
jgi:hypothetical protein